MQLAIVPWVPPARQPPRRGSATGMHFAEWMRRNTHANPQDADDDEEKPLVSKRKERINKSYWSSLFIVGMLSLLALLVFGIFAILYYRVDSALVSAENAIAPHAATILNRTLNMLESSEESMKHVHTVLEHGEMLSEVGAPQIAQSLNHTEHMLARLEKLLAHPTLQISLEDTPMGG